MYETYFIVALAISWLILIPILVYVIRNLYIKNGVYEGWIVKTRDSVSEIRESIKDIDSKEIFESDDEVGVVYTGIRDIILDLDSKINEDDI
jgi:hypothetical protein